MLVRVIDLCHFKEFQEAGAFMVTKDKTAVSILLAIVAVWYVSFPMLITSASLIELRVDDLRSSQDGVRVDFVVKIHNRGFWPLVLTGLRWTFAADYQTVEPHFPKGPESLTLLPLQTIGIDGYVVRVVDWFYIGYMKGLYGQEIDVKIRRVTVAVKGTVATFGASGLTAVFDLSYIAVVPG